MKPQLGELIVTGNAIYGLHDCKWSVSPVTPAQMLADKDKDMQDFKIACRVVRDETIDGVSATLFSVHEENDGIITDSQLWLAKASGLPVHRKDDVTETRFVYSNIVAPPVH